MAIPLLPYAPIAQNARVERIRLGSDEDLKVVALDQSMDAGNLTTVIESAYRQIFFHAFKSDRDRFLESQLRNGQITVRDFIRGLCLSDTFTRTFYGYNSNYKVVRHLVERLLGRKTSGKGEELSWAIVIATKGVAGMVDALLDSEEYLDNFGYDTVPYQRHRVLPGRDLGDTPFNITTPRYDEYHRDILGFPQIVFTGDFKRLPDRARLKRGGDPSDYMSWVGSMSAVNMVRAKARTSDNYMDRVPYRSISR